MISFYEALKSCDKDPNRVNFSLLGPFYDLYISFYSSVV